MKERIKIQYQTSDGLLWDNHEEALVNEALLQDASLYLEEYRRKSIVEAIAKNLNISPKVSNES